MSRYTKDKVEKAFRKWNYQSPGHTIECRRVSAAHYYLHDMSLEELAKLFGVSQSTIERDLHDIASSGSIEYIEGMGGESKKVDHKSILRLIKSRPYWDIDELRQEIHDEWPLASNTLIDDSIDKAGYNFTEVTRVIGMNDAVKSFKRMEKAQSAIDQISLAVAEGREVIFADETEFKLGHGTNQPIAPRKHRHTRMQDAKSRKSMNITICAFISETGLISYSKHISTPEQDGFTSSDFVELAKNCYSQLAVKNNDKPLLVLGNSRVHGNEEMEKIGFEICKLPPHTPDANPCKFLFHFLKRSISQLLWPRVDTMTPEKWSAKVSSLVDLTIHSFTVKNSHAFCIEYLNDVIRYEGDLTFIDLDEVIVRSKQGNSDEQHSE